MSNTQSRLALWWQQLSPRDRLVLSWAGPIIAVLLAYILLVAPLQRYHQQVAERLVGVKGDYHWLQQQEGVAVDSCRANSNVTVEQWVKQQAVQLGVAGLSIKAGGESEWELRVGSGSGQGLLRLLDRAQCRGLSPLAVNLQRGSNNDGGWTAEASLLDVSGGS
jgi:type II secretory pathway component PulM